MDEFIGHIIGILLISWALQWLWNDYLVGAISGINEITYVQALAIKVITNILFKSTLIHKIIS